MQNNHIIYTFPKEKKNNHNALTFGLSTKNTHIFLKKTARFKRLFRQLCNEYQCETILEREILQDIACLYAEKELILQAKASKIKERFFELLSDPQLPCYATAGQSPAFQNAVPHHIYKLLTTEEDDSNRVLKNNQMLLDETETEYTTAIVKKAQLEKEMANYPDPSHDIEIYRRQCDEHLEKYAENYSAIKEYIQFLTSEALPPLYNVMIALLYRDEIWAYLHENAVILSENTALYLDKKNNNIDRKIETKIALFFKIKHTKNL